MIKKRDLKAQGHLEVILSFALFIGAIIFIFIFINPFAKTKESVSGIDDIRDSFIDEISSTIGRISVIGIESGAGSEYILPSEYGNSFKEVSEPNTNPLKLNIYFSNEVFGSGVKNTLFDSYELGVYSEEDMVVWEKIVNLKQDYETGYSDLKSSLGAKNDFAFSFNKIDLEEVSELSVLKDSPIGVDVESKQFPVRVIDSLGKIHELILNIRVW